MLHAMYLPCVETAETLVFVCLCTELMPRGLQFNELKSYELFHTGVLLRMVIRGCNAIDVALQLSSR